MRKNNIRRWLHCALDFLPLLLIPVFMIYSHRHTLTERTEVDVTYRYQSNEVNTLDDLVVGNLYYLRYMCFADDIDFYAFNDFTIGVASLGSNSPQMNDDYWYDITSVQKLTASITCRTSDNGAGYYDLNIMLDNDAENSYVGASDYYFDAEDLYFYLSSDYDLTNFKLFYNASILIYPECAFPQYSDYNVIEDVTITGNDNILSVFTEDFYNATHTYFNMDNVGNLGGMYNWVETNMFGGNVPLGIHAVWHIITYEFVMDIIFLIYSVFMFIIDFTEKFLTSMYDKSFGGGK